MKEQIQQLIADGRTEEALALLAQHSSDALLLQARYNNGKKDVYKRQRIGCLYLKMYRQLIDCLLIPLSYYVFKPSNWDVSPKQGIKKGRTVLYGLTWSG